MFLAQVFFCEFCETFKNTFSTEHFWTTASGPEYACEFHASVFELGIYFLPKQNLEPKNTIFFKARYCPAILQPANGLVSPPDCMSKNSKQYKDVCTFTCDEGFEPRGNSADRAFCDEFGQWNLLGKLALHCHRKFFI